ncbi:MAG: ShlB/FhaC/HecB family hemolysin secretion/activation protein [Allosphingosinicella sp.]
MATRVLFLLAGVRRAIAALTALALPCAALGAELQNPVDRIDAAVVQQTLRDREPDARRQSSTEISAEPESADAMMSDAAFIVGAVRVDGATALSPADFAPAIEPYLGRRLGETELRALARDVAGVARAAGFVLATASIPPQDVVNGILRVQLDEGRIDAIEVEGAAQRLVEARLAPLADGRPVRTAQLEHRLRIAGAVAGVDVGQVRLVRRGGRSVLVVASEYRRVSGSAWLDNWGSDSVGPVRLRVTADLNGLLVHGDRLTVGGVGTPLQPSEYQFGLVGYSLPLGTAGTEASIRGYVGHTDPGGELRANDIDGNSYEFALGLTHPLKRSRNDSLWATFELNLRDSELKRDGLDLRDDRIVTANLGLFAAGKLGGGRARASLNLAQGLDLFDATRRGDPLASRRDAGGAFTRFSFWGEYSQGLGGDFSLAVSAEGQLASRPLLSSEEIGLGGRPFLRGYEYRERAGDRGAMIATELRFDLRDLPRPIRDAQLYAFADAGKVSNLDGGRGGGTLASAGAGFRLWAEHGIEGAVELGVPLRDGALGRPDPRLSFIFGVRF